MIPRPPATVDPQTMLELLAIDPEGWACLSGMIAVLRLPRLHGFESCPRIVEVEFLVRYINGTETEVIEWHVISAVVVAHREVAFYAPGDQHSWLFPLERDVYRGIPRWRQLRRGPPPALIEDHIDRRNK